MNTHTHSHTLEASFMGQAKSRGVPYYVNVCVCVCVCVGTAPLLMNSIMPELRDEEINF